MVFGCACGRGPAAPSWATGAARAAPGWLPDATVLPRVHRLRRSAEFSNVVRRGSRAASRSVVLHQVKRDDDGPVRVGFVVGRVVGNASTRNLVKRRLRHLVAARLSGLPGHSSLVVRANAGAASLTFVELGRDFDSGVRALAGRRSPR